MADVTLKNGKEITFDLYSFTFEEYTKIFTADNEDIGNELIARAAGMTAEEYMQLPYPDNRKVYSMFFKSCREVMTNPNLGGAPTSA